MKIFHKLSLTAVLAALLLSTTGAAAGAPPALCARLKAGEVGWVTLTAAGDVDQQVSDYPSGTTLITPLFAYDCVPKQTTIVAIFSFNGQTVHTDKQTLKSTSRKGLYGAPLSSGSAPFDDGEWSVQFYSGKTLLTEGSIRIGGDNSGGQPSGYVAVQGKVTDKQSRRPIKGAVVLVLNPGVSVQSWLDGGRAESDILTVGKSDAAGQFALASPLERDQPYAIVVAASGYRATGRDNFIIDASAPDPLTLNISMTK